MTGEAEKARTEKEVKNNYKKKKRGPNAILQTKDSRLLIAHVSRAKYTLVHRKREFIGPCQEPLAQPAILR
jgi:hypothetical protein